MIAATAEAASTSSALVPLPVILPLLAAGLKLAIGVRLQRTQRVISSVVLAAVLAVALVLLIDADRHGPQVMYAGGWKPPVGIVLVADRLSALMLVISSAVTLCVLLYSIGQGMADNDEATPLSIYHPSYLVLVAGVSDTFLAGDLFNLYVGFEIMLTASYVLLTLGGTVTRIRAGATYAIVSLLSSVLFLAAIAVVYAATGTVTMAQLAGRLDRLPDGVSLMAQISLLTVFCIKAAVFPLAAWLPDSYPTAPAPVTAVFAGLLTKVGIYAMLRTQTLLFPDGRLDDALLVLALLSLVVGILGAVAQTDLKRLLSFTLISHIGFMVFGIALASRPGFAGAVFYVAHHITVQTTLFLVVGLVERRGVTTDMQRLGGIAKLSPVLGLVFFIPAMNLAGVPPLSGFLGKLALLRAGFLHGGALVTVVIAAATATSLLTLYALAKAWNLAFWRAAPPELYVLGVVLDIVESDESDDTEEREGTGTAGAAAAGAYGTSAEPGSAPGGPVDVQVLSGRTEAATFGGRAITTGEPPATMLGPTIAMVSFGLAFTVLAGPLTSLTERVADELTARTPYVEAVTGR
ncbi:multisubunit sodium/proton antiporter, MrpD subunit (TC 2.A.63.1) [Streptomyces sp. WMMB 714]|uniref:Na+/H+ antiporter subunit D n=1 Tax=Streptomyces sp. WMMB 714 TaxID=1286822 RepID=UPI0005F83662|nr:Na+/H+ antiporter subunit D [Streptomyces sp. WMMB 714]SCK05981.1 multisubunit sodium/proton antiporter, MrpD subunit (TC 2.A.63.1) [Streptomyces sp. WMMB 714]